MSLLLEDTIMQEIGLGAHYNYFNGSGSCEYIRKKAARKLESTIQRHHDEGDEIAAPDLLLIDIVRQVATWGDNSRYSLTKTWQAASYVIAHHIHAFHSEPDAVGRMADELVEYIREAYLPREFTRKAEGIISRRWRR
jgi:hypothetical protein